MNMRSLFSVKWVIIRSVFSLERVIIWVIIMTWLRSLLFFRAVVTLVSDMNEKVWTRRIRTCSFGYDPWDGSWVGHVCFEL